MFHLYFLNDIVECPALTNYKQTPNMSSTTSYKSIWVCPNDGSSTHKTVVGMPHTGKLTKYPLWQYDDTDIGKEMLSVSDLVPLRGQVVVVQSPGPWVTHFLALRPDITVRYTRNWSWCPQCSEEVAAITTIDAMTEALENVRLS